MRFVLGKTRDFLPSRWFVDVETAGFSFVDVCRQRGQTEYASQKLSRGIDPSLDILAEIRARTILTKPPFRYMNPLGGGCDTLIIEREVDADDFPIYRILPGDCSIIKFMEGKHFYAKLPDGRDIEWEGQRKWTTQEYALKAIKKFLSQAAYTESVAGH